MLHRPQIIADDGERLDVEVLSGGQVIHHPLGVVVGAVAAQQLALGKAAGVQLRSIAHALHSASVGPNRPHHTSVQGPRLDLRRV